MDYTKEIIQQKLRTNVQWIRRSLELLYSFQTEEEKQLESWRQEINSIKNQIEKVDKDIFSKIE